MKKYKKVLINVEEDLLDDILKNSKDLFKVEEEKVTYLKPITKVSQKAKMEKGFSSNGELVFDHVHKGRVMEKTLTSGEISLFLDRKAVKRGSEYIRMTPGEIELLTFLMEHPFVVHTKEIIVAELSKDGKYLSSESVTMRIQRMRKSLHDTYTNPEYIETRVGLGYSWMKASYIKYKIY